MATRRTSTSPRSRLGRAAALLEHALLKRALLVRAPFTQARLLAVLGLAALSASTAACQSQPAASPRGAIDAYGDALARGDTRAAYELLSRETRAELSYDEFQKRLAESPDEVQALVRSLDRPSEPPYVTATVVTRDGQVLELVYEDGAWRVTEAAVDLYSQSTPERAIDSFVRALHNRRFDVLLRFVPDSQREGLDAHVLAEAWDGEQKLEMERIGEGLRLALPTAKVETLGDRATMSYGAGATVELVREHGLWKIEDFK
ncbi:MAG TPA: hypothetical protein VLC09_04905 [Polyangiaceae bacterium]|nr:hypothetical protein [Polyangiaceae bacterium]